MTRIYLDHAATSPLRPEVERALAEAARETSAHAGGQHAEGRAARARLEQARARILRVLGASEFELVFTSGGTESDQLAILGTVLRACGERVITSAVEHSAVLGLEPIVRAIGSDWERVPVDADARVDLERLEEQLRAPAALLSVQSINNEVGTVQPIAELAVLARAAGVRFHVDAVQSLARGHLHEALPHADLISLSAHKVGGPQGLGALLVRRGLALAPLVAGTSQESGRRAGTENVAGAVGFAVAVESAAAESAASEVGALRESLREGILARVNGVRENSPRSGSAPHILHVSFEGVGAQALLAELDRCGFAVSTGSACHASDPRPSHVLTAMGRTPSESRGSIRFSLGWSSTRAGIDAAIDAIPRAVERLRAISGWGPRTASSALPARAVAPDEAPRRV